MNFSKVNLHKLKVTIMGLGLNGGGLQSALYFARAGAKVTVTDLRDEHVLQPSIQQLAGYPIHFVLGRHQDEDFSRADLVIKNPGVPLHSPYLKLARSCNVAIESDLSVFLSLSRNLLIAVTGSKGKSTTASAIYFVLEKEIPGSRLGGNITVSPLSFLDELSADAPVVLELSSWQLADLEGKGVLRPQITILTNILPDHQNVYSSMEDYISDKKLIFRDQPSTGYSIFNYDDPVLRAAGAESPARVQYFSAAPLPAGLDGGWLEQGEGFWKEAEQTGRLFGAGLAIPGRHNHLNLLAAALALKTFGISPEVIARHLPRFNGIGHRLELFWEKGALRFYNDSAATIPHATVEAVRSVPEPIFLICGGTDKNIDFSPLLEIAAIPRRIFLLAGSATDKITALFASHGISCPPPYTHLQAAIEAAIAAAAGKGSILLSPGCASFGMFLNEFDRGNRFMACVRDLMA